MFVSDFIFLSDSTHHSFQHYACAIIVLLTYSAWASFTIGASTSVITQFVQPTLLYMATSNGGLTYTTLCRLHLYVCGLGSLCYWRGVWNLVDLYTGTGWESSLAVYAVWQMLSFVTRTARTNVGLPLSIQLDTDPELLQANTAFNVKVRVPRVHDRHLCIHSTNFGIEMNTLNMQ